MPPAARRAGVGSQLLTAAARMAAGWGQRAVLTVSSDSAAAIAMYERRGWRQVHTRLGGWRTADEREVGGALLREPMSRRVADVRSSGVALTRAGTEYPGPGVAAFRPPRPSRQARGWAWSCTFLSRSMETWV
ncbi:GNAT family N-acetyltransferase [Nocardia arthritidis]|uniref:GNAT family N-acetyltransferase n=1 Tax=Nocardia arthritidis TaxID=228602 RepID=UPI00350E46E2